MAYPADQTVLERIMENIRSTIDAIATPAYKNTVRHCGWMGGEDFIVPGYPAVLLTSSTVDENDSTHAIISCVLNVQMTLVIEQEGDEVVDMSGFLSDVKVALLTDYTRGGLAVTTKVTRGEMAPFDIIPPYIVADMSVQVQFRHLYADPTTAI